jgi:hypothetical protein
VLRAEEAGELLLFTFARISAAGSMNVGDIFHQHSSLSSEASGSDGSVRPTADLLCKTQDFCTPSAMSQKGGEATFAGMGSKEEDAPIPDLRGTAIEGPDSTEVDLHVDGHLVRAKSRSRA